jgi:hypothetical protein
MKFLPGPETRAAVVAHPIVMAGLAVMALLGITAGVLIVIDSARGDSSKEQRVEIEPRDTQTPGPVSKTATASGVTGRTNTTTAVRSAPGARSVRGTLPSGRDVVIDGRSAESGWYRIIFPPNSELHGWVDAEDLDITGDPTLLRVATPEPAVIVDLPTTDPDLQLTPVESTTPENPDGTSTPDTGMPDLAIGTTPIVSEGQLFITVVNQGTGDVTADLVVAIFTVDGSSLLGGATLPGFTLEAGASIDIGTGYAVTEDQALLLIVDPNGDVEESDNTNNQITISIGVEEEPETPTEAPTDEPPAE